MASGERQEPSRGYLRWLGVGSVVAGLGASIVTGQGTATAVPSDSAQPADTTSDTTSAAADTDAGDTDPAAETGQADGSAGQGPEQVVGGGSSSGPTSTVSAQQVTGADDDPADDADDAAQPTAEELAEELTEEVTEDESEDVTAGADSEPSATPAATDSADTGGSGGIDDEAGAPEADVSASPTTGTSGGSGGAASPAPELAAADDTTGDDASSAELSEETVAALAAPVAASRSEAPALAAALAVPAGAPAALSTQVTAAPVTVKSILTDVLTWFGFGRLAQGLPIPAMPVPALIEGMWLAVRQFQYTWNNQRPTAQPTISGQGPDGVITGNLNAVDYEGDVISYSVYRAPEHGSVVVDSTGFFTYTPELVATTIDGVAASALPDDGFSILLDDELGNPPHAHGLLGLFDHWGTVVPVTISTASVVSDLTLLGSGTGSAGPAPAVVGAGGDSRNQVSTADPVDLGDLAARDDVAVGLNSDGTVRVIHGTFTDNSVATAADAADVLNSVAPALGATPGFADPAGITIQRAGAPGEFSETFYRLSHSVDGVAVLGSEVILVTDAGGRVTGLFNNHVEVTGVVDMAPDVSLDEAWEANLLAGAAYLGGVTAGEPDQAALDAFVESAAFTNDLVVYALDDSTGPSLAWRVNVLPSGSAATQHNAADQPSATGATYYFQANGPNAGAVIASVSNLANAASTITARDALGQNRSINIDTQQVLFFSSSSLFDTERNIKTYKTSYSFFGFGGPVIPGKIIKRGWFGWPTGAVSAHANTAVAYDYYQDVLGRTSFDDQGMLIEVNVDYNPRESFLDFLLPYTNAFWDPVSQQLGFGNGGNLEAALDVVAHEYTHGVVSWVVGGGGSVLDHGESGALNEALADVMGLLIEDKAGAGRWLIGEDADYPGGAVRSLADPNAYSATVGRYRDHYSERYTGTGDEGGEHVNSTIFSHAVYKMMTDPATGGVSSETWAQVFYHSLFRLSPGAVFVDGRDAVISSAIALDFTEAQLTAMENAFDEVGIGAGAALAVAV